MRKVVKTVGSQLRCTTKVNDPHHQPFPINDNVLWSNGIVNETELVNQAQCINQLLGNGEEGTE